MNDTRIIALTPENIENYGLCGYKNANKHVELRNKFQWFEEYYPLGLRINALVSENGGYQGMIEYIPGEYAHRPVKANNYLFIHCLFVGFNKQFKGEGHATNLINDCIEDAQHQNKDGVAVVTRKGSFMAGKEVFLKNGFAIKDKSKPDFELVAFKLKKDAPDPAFKDMEILLSSFKDGLFIFRSVQCPYTEKNVNAILNTAREKYNLQPELIDLNTHELAMNSPCPFGTFGIIYNGKIISYHPISNTRFENIMEKILN